MPMPERLEFICPVKILCGLRSLEHMPYELAARNARRPLLLSDEDAFRENRSLALVDALRESDLHLGAVEQLPATVDRRLVQELAAIYRDRDHDALVVMGSGPLVDLAKLLNLVVSTGQDDPQVFSNGSAGIDPHIKPMVLIAPAAATGYEASGRVQTDWIALRSVGLMPDLVCIDERTLGAPGIEDLLTTGVTALALGTEAVLSAYKNPIRAIYATNAVQMATAALNAADQMPDAVDPRRHLAAAAVMTGCTLADHPPGLLPQLAGHLAETGRVSADEALGILLPVIVAYGTRNWGWSSADLLPALVGRNRSASTPARQRSMQTITTLMALMNALFDHTAGRIPRTLHDAGFTFEELAPLAASFAPENAEAASGAVESLLAAALKGALPLSEL